MKQRKKHGHNVLATDSTQQQPKVNNVNEALRGGRMFIKRKNCAHKTRIWKAEKKNGVRGGRSWGVILL